MDKIPEKMTLDAQWTDDCSGKKDYDAPIIAISTRYWPRGGGMLVVTNTPGQPVKIEGNDERPEIKPSAKSSLIIRFAEDGGMDGVLAENEFEGESFESVKAQVESWAQVQMDRAVAALRREFGR